MNLPIPGVAERRAPLSFLLLLAALAAVARVPASLGAEMAIQTVAKAHKGPENLWELLVAGGIVMVPIGFCSLLALGVAIERAISLRRSRVAPPDFVEKLKVALGNVHEPDLPKALAFCQAQGGPISEIFRAGIARLKRGPDAIEKAIEDAGGREVQKMKRSVRPLATIASIAMLLGLLGTVYGLIIAFRVTAEQAVNRAEVLAEGIYVAMVTTAAGLTLAIPVMVIHSWFCGRLDRLVDSIDEQAISFVEYVAESLEKPPAPAPAAAAAPETRQASASVPAPQPALEGAKP